MKTGKVSYLSDLHFDHIQWKSELAFWSYELKFMNQQLSEIVEQSRKQQVLAQAEHFQNVFALHREEISVIKHKISWHEELLAKVARLLPSEVEQHHFTDHQKLRDRMDKERKMFRQLKDEFFYYLEEQSATLNAI